MPKTDQNMFSQNYKRKSCGVDKRAMRAYRKSVDRKQLRDQVLSRKRNLTVLQETTAFMSPVAEKLAKNVPSKSDDAKETDGSSMFVCRFQLCFVNQLDQRDVGTKAGHSICLPSLPARPQPLRVLPAKHFSEILHVI